MRAQGYLRRRRPQKVTVPSALCEFATCLAKVSYREFALRFMVRFGLAGVIWQLGYGADSLQPCCRIAASRLGAQSYGCIGNGRSGSKPINWSWSKGPSGRLRFGAGAPCSVSELAIPALEH